MGPYKSGIASTDQHLFLINFRGKSSGGEFICSYDKLAEVIEKAETHGINFIKIYDSGKNRFKRVSRSQILQFCPELKDHRYFT